MLPLLLPLLLPLGGQGRQAGTDFPFHCTHVHLITLPAAAPQPPLQLRLLSATGGALHLTWTLDVDDGGADLLRATVHLQGPGADKELLVTTPGLRPVNATLLQLDPSSSYSLLVRVHNWVGPSNYSLPLTVATLAASLPTAPPQPTVGLPARGGRAVLNWEHSFDWGDSAITGWLL